MAGGRGESGTTGGAGTTGGRGAGPGPDTTAVRGGLRRSPAGETSEPVHLTSGFVFDDAEQAEDAFLGDNDRYVYSRYGNPTVEAFTERLRLLEGAEACLGTASGMAAVFAALGGLLAAGDRLVASRAMFGSCAVVVTEVLPRWGVRTELVDGTDLDAWAQALATPAQAVFLESPSNPMLDLVDVAAVAELAHAAGAVVVVDNVLASPVLCRPLGLGADVVVYSATKHMDGQGRVLGGAVLGPADLVDGEIGHLVRHTGPTLSPFNAWTLLKGLETMPLRVRHSSEAALRCARWLEGRPGVAAVRHPFLASHPQHDLARAQMSGGGTVLALELAGDGSPAGARRAAFAFLDALELVDISNNLGDTRSLACHPATTTHRALSGSVRRAQGITDGVVRVSVGLEDVEDVLADLDRALAAATR
ncbi:O-succinylhomoserine sulfhydrylase [Jannaschia sp. R86511]|uniref:O-succinylhomoserine sulfhydrylase n=1 Tax=Jannaschia sp. R86511 TaxID=3093853 RepID=UPI0036D3F0CB